MFLDTDTEYGLSTLGGPGPLSQKFASPVSGASKAGQDYSELGPLGPDVPASFAGRSAVSLLEIAVSDTASLSATEDPTDGQEITTAPDVAAISVTESVQLFNNIAVTDAATLAVSDTVGIEQSGTPEVTPTDTASLSVTESVSLDVSLDVTDDADITATEDEPATVDVSTDTLTASDDASLTLSEFAVLDVFVGALEFNVEDTATLTVSETSAVAVVEGIARINFAMRAPSIRFRMGR